MTPEMELVLACAQARPEPAVIRKLVEGNVDWPRLLELAERHGLAPLLCWRLKATCAEAVPSETLAALGASFRRNAERNLFLTGELVKVWECLAAAGLAAVPYKGPVLAWSAYGHPGLREFSDLDILVRVEDVPQARELLRSQGYRPQTPLEGPLERTFLRWIGQMPWLREDHQVCVDLHWRLAWGCAGLRWDKLRLAPVEVGGREILTLCPEDTLLFLAAHGAKHGWTPLTCVCDLAMLLENWPLDWDAALARARQWRLVRRLLVGLGLAHDLLETSLPAGVLARIRADARVAELIALARARLLTGIPACGDEAFQLRSMDRFRDRLRCRLSQIFEPTEADWAALHIPPALFPLYYLARPLRLLAKHGARLLLRL